MRDKTGREGERVTFEEISPKRDGGQTRHVSSNHQSIPAPILDVWLRAQEAP
jgi:hypothetical protein